MSYRHELSKELSNFRTANIFNRLRPPPGDLGRPRVSFLGVSLKGRNLRDHDLSDARFTNCSFDNIDFAKLNNVEFANCTFQNCRFSDHPPAHDTSEATSIAIKSATFYLVTFKDTHFVDVHLENILFARCHFITPPRFEAAKLKGSLEISQSGDWPAFKNLPDLEFRVNWDTSVKTDFVVSSPAFVNWTHIRNLQQIPFLQVSLIGLILLTTQVYLVDMFFYLVRWPELTCRRLEQLASEAKSLVLNEQITTFCAKLASTKITDAISQSVTMAMFMFLLLFAASLVHKIRGPSEIAEYSINQWRIDHSRPGVFYELLANRNQSALLFTLVCYVGGSGLFLYLFVVRIITIMRVPII